jgi:hypothetical protein
MSSVGTAHPMALMRARVSVMVSACLLCRVKSSRPGKSVERAAFPSALNLHLAPPKDRTGPDAAMGALVHAAGTAVSHRQQSHRTRTVPFHLQ